MPQRLQIVPTIHKEKIRTVSLGTNARLFKASEIGKAVKLIGPGQYDLCAADDKIEGIVTSSEYETYGATRGGLTIGGIVCSGYVEVVSAEVLAVGDYVVAAAQPALGTPVQSIGAGDIPCTPVKKAGASPTAPFLMRIVDLSLANPGAAGTVCIAEFV